MFKLVIQDDEGKTTVVPLIRDEITIGRKEGNTIRLTERNVSRKHAKISRNNGAVAIEDLGSYNGVKVNGTRILQKVTLNVSDRVQIGDYLIELKAEGAEQPVNPAFSEDARTQPIERLDPAALGSLGMAPPPQPAAPMGTADTDPARRAVPGPAPAPAPQTPARLVVLSSNFAGQQFAISKSPCVIGRTDESDIVINHRSISRNHAQIKRDPTGRYTIEDLKSANGVRVNGEDYGTVELRRGDTIDLGHVRLRFVEPGEDFVFGRDAQVVDVPTAGGKKTWLWGLIGVAVVAGVIIVVVAGGGGKKGKGEQVAAGSGPSPTVATGAGTTGGGSAAAGSGAGSEAGSAAAAVAGDSTDGAAAVPAPAIDAGEAAVAVGPGTGAAAVDSAAVAQALADARAAVAASDWTAAAEKARAALAADPGNADAKAIADQAKREAANETQFKAFTDAAAAKKYDKAVAAFDNISTDSVYKNQARGTYDQLHDEFVERKKGEARLLAKQKKCREITVLARSAGNIFPDARTEMEKIPCESSTEVATSPGPGTGGGSSGGSSGGAATPPPSGKSAADLLNEAQTATQAGTYGRALSLAEQAMRAPGLDAGQKVRAVTIAALAACNLKNAAKAKQYIAQLPANRKPMVAQTCLKQGVDPQ
jgi:pSer/pThr/pTyr-binding forkhead associated (FHA) protein